MNIRDIKLYSKNAKVHPSKQLKQIAESIDKLGFDQAVVVDKNGEIIIGHGRFLAARDILGWTDIKIGFAMAKKGEKFIPILLRDDLSEQEIKVRRLNDNKLNESEWDFNLAIEELKGLSEEMFELTGFDADLLIEPDEKDDVIPENVPARTKIGDLYELGQHRVLCGDSTKIEDVERLMNGKKADMVFTDPPYGVGYEKKSNEILGNGRKTSEIKNDNLKKEDLQIIINAVFKNLKNNLADTNSYYICSPQGGEMGLMMMMMMNNGIPCRHVLIWYKNSPVFSMGRLDYDYQHEPMLYGWTKKHKFFGGGQFNKSVWNLNRPTKSKLHPTMKPVELVQNAILNSSEHNQIVLDLFLGSGTTLIASEKTGRICYGMELSPAYTDVIVQRYCDFTGNYDIIKNNKPIKWQKKQEEEKPLTPKKLVRK